MHRAVGFQSRTCLLTRGGCRCTQEVVPNAKALRVPGETPGCLLSAQVLPRTTSNSWDGPPHWPATDPSTGWTFGTGTQPTHITCKLCPQLRRPQATSIPVSGGTAPRTKQPPHSPTWEIGDPFPIQLVGDANFNLVQGIQDVQFGQGQPIQTPMQRQAGEAASCKGASPDSCLCCSQQVGAQTRSQKMQLAQAGSTASAAQVLTSSPHGDCAGHLALFNSCHHTWRSSGPVRGVCPPLRPPPQLPCGCPREAGSSLCLCRFHSALGPEPALLSPLFPLPLSSLPGHSWLASASQWGSCVCPSTVAVRQGSAVLGFVLALCPERLLGTSVAPTPALEVWAWCCPAGSPVCLSHRCCCVGSLQPLPLVTAVLGRGLRQGPGWTPSSPAGGLDS